MLRGVPQGRHLGLIFALLAPWPSLSADSRPSYVRSAGPVVLTYDELLAASEPDLPADLAAKIKELTTTPFVDNSARYAGVEPHRPDLPGLGPSLRVVHWNIARGIRLDAVMDALTDRNAFIERAVESADRTDASRLLRELDAMQTADVLVLNEVDWGMRRSEYRDVVRELAQALRMNWAFGVEFIEVDPIALGVEEFEEVEDEVERAEMAERIRVDPNRVRALHGTAVLSRYPIARASLVPFSTAGYDWYQSERDKISKLEEGKRAVAGAVFLEKVRREIRRGGRTCLYVTLDVPDLVGGKLLIAAPHLENRTDPSNRVLQMEEVLEQIKDVDHPVVLAGDLNTTFSDTSPTSIQREVLRTLGSSEFWAEKAIKYATGLGLFYDVVTGGVNFIKNHSDPTAADVPIVAPNPEYELFKTLEEWRFTDGTVFDFRGDKKRSAGGQKGTLGNSNERDKKGFAETFAVERTIGPAGKLKLDWILLKDYIESPRDATQTYRFAPHNALTMRTLNDAVEDRLSDHTPISVDLPFGDPDEVAPVRKKRFGLF